MDRHSRIFVAGAGTLIGSGLIRVLAQQGYENVVPASAEPDLAKAAVVEAFFKAEQPEYVFLAAGKSGGIAFNQTHPTELMLDNLLIQCHVMDCARRYGVRKLLYLASSCSYPRSCPQPMREDSLLTGPLEPTNEPYAVAKIAGIKLAQSCRVQFGSDFICAIPANCFGPGDDFSPENSHVVGALMRRMREAIDHGAEEVVIWGTGKPRREFIYVDELAAACIFVMDRYEGTELINIGPGGDVSIADLATMIKEATGFVGSLSFDASKPDGMPVKLLETSKLRDLGWRPSMSFPEALRATWRWYVSSCS